LNSGCFDKGYKAREVVVECQKISKQELRRLDEKGLTKLIVKAAGGELVVHKNMQNKIAHDFVVEGQEIAQFLDRSEEKPGVCHLYRHSLNVKCLLPKEHRMEREKTYKAKHRLRLKNKGGYLVTIHHAIL